MSMTSHKERKRTEGKHGPRPSTETRRPGGAFDDLQRDIGNQAVGRLIQTEKDKAAAPARSVYETAAAKSTGMPDAVVEVWGKEAAGSTAAVFVVNGEMIDAPHIIQARRIVERARLAETDKAQ